MSAEFTVGGSVNRAAILVILVWQQLARCHGIAGLTAALLEPAHMSAQLLRT